MYLTLNGIDEGVKYKDVFHQSEKEFSAYNFEYADTKILLSNFEHAENECKNLLIKNLLFQHMTNV